MSVGETRVQHDYIMKFLCRKEEDGGLGYRQTDPNIVSSDLFIPSQLAEFVERANPLVWKSLMTRFHQDEIALANALKEKVKELLLNSSNVATFLNNYKTITFEGETVPLFFVSDTELQGDRDFNKNIFSAVEEMPHNVVCDGMTLQKLRPDISFFLNGIFIGYLELKYVSKGQTAAKHGRGKIIGDYLESVKDMANRAKTDADTVASERKKTLHMFERGIHIVATDINETYVLRNIAGYYDEAFKGFADGTLSINKFAPTIEKDFKLYPVSSPLLDANERFEEIMANLYGKKMVEREILYYNFLKYNYEKKQVTEKGKKVWKRVRLSNRGYIIAPRPKQKYGCDRILSRVKEMLSNEHEADFYSKQLRRELEALCVPADTIDSIIHQREAFSNNKYVYSLLLQYAAGFGKSNIIGWTALQLKDLRHNGAYAYDKILIVVDRLQLRDQLDEMMTNMNIDKAMFVEATDQDTFIKALSDSADGKRIIVVNIQKFLDLQQAIKTSGKRLKKMRVAFLIDEIHRSNTGDSNKEMLDIFEKLQAQLVNAAEQGGEIKKKNLIIGFTATPTQKVLSRFGEFKSDPHNIPLWVPFDSYTMREAIDDGYILDPTKRIIKVAQPMRFDLPEGVDPDDDSVKIRLAKEAIYANLERMEAFADFIVNRLVSLVYGKIRGTGKAMLAVTSIPNAINYCNLIRKKMAVKCQDPKYSRYKDAPIAIVYSDNQEYESCSSMNYGKSEADVIKDFKADKNGLIIVVDKLQTGFDEPKLHTLFLDKEISGVNAIQTISRVNRTCKYKEDCHIVDLSWQNVNEKNIKAAFEEFCDTVVSQFDPLAEARVLDEYYKDLTSSEPFTKWFAEFCTHQNDAEFGLKMEDGLRKWIKRQFDLAEESEEDEPTNEAKRLRRIVGKYGASLEMLDGVYEVDAKYRNPLFLDFWERYCLIYRSLMTGAGSGIIHPDVETDDHIPGLTITEPEEEGGDEGGGGTPPSGSEPSIMDMLRRWNKREELTAEDVERWQAEIDKMFEIFMADERFMAVMRDSTFSLDMKQEEYRKQVNKYRRSLSKRNDIDKVELFKEMLTDNHGHIQDLFMTLIGQ